MLDEPTTGVDVDAQEALAELLDALHSELGVTILYVSHEFGAVEHFVERLVLVRERIVFDGPPVELPGMWHDPSHTPMLDLEFMRLAFAAGAIVGVLAPAVGFFLVQREMSLIGDGIGHVAFAGVAAGYLLGVSPVLTALAAAVIGAVAIEWLRARRQARPATRRSRSSSTPASPPASCSISAAGALNANLFAYLFGSILTVTRSDLARDRRARPRRARASIAVLLRALLAVSLDEEGARVAGPAGPDAERRRRGARGADDRASRCASSASC